MSKEKTAAPKGKAAKTEEVKKKAPPIQKASDLFKYTVADLASTLGIQESSIRVGLRASSFKREASAWGWNDKKSFDEVVAYFKERSGRKPETLKGKAKPVAPTTSKAAAKPSKGKKAA